ncbi:cytochrome c3 family protein [Leptothrix sp. BB-4]
MKLLRALVFLTGLLTGLVGLLPAAQAQTAGRNFDHNRTGFVLSGAHARERCESCHVNGVFKGTPRDCQTCHTAGNRLARTNTVKSSDHIPTTAPCETCHNSQSFSGARFSHAGVVRGTCTTCHNMRNAPGKPSNHIATTASCDTCHRTTAWLPATGTDHSTFSAATNCASCHNGTSATGKTARHITTGALNCTSCHSTRAWLPSSWNHSQMVVAGTCSSCHNGNNASGKSPTHMATTAQCDTCHKSTSSWAASTKVDHGTFTVATNCSTCHNGSTATGKPMTHIPVAATNCIACHTTTGWKPHRFTHSQVVVTNQCSSCHNGSYPPADGRSATHIPYQSLTGVAITNCDTCHKAGFVSWTPARLHTSVTVTAQCATCHLSIKPATGVHVGVTGNCESCHRSTASWASATFAHSPTNAVGTGTCDTCHNGVTARGKSTTHIPVPAATAKCDSCHRSQTAFATAVTMNHSVVNTATCKSCHSGAYLAEGIVGALAKPANHIPEGLQLLNGSAMDCNACHRSTTVWTTVTMNHNGSMGNGSGWCKGCHQSGTAFLGAMDRMAVNHRNRTPAPTDCSMSGCHRPLGSFGSTYTRWN